MIILQHLIQTDQFKTTLILLDEYIVAVGLKPGVPDAGADERSFH